MSIVLFTWVALAGLPIAAPAPQAQDASGKWDLVVPARQGEQNFVLSLTKAGEKLTGTVTSPEGQATGEGTQKESAVSMTFSYESDRGPRSVTLTGTQDGDAMKGTVVLAPGQAPVEWSAKRTPAGTPSKQGSSGTAVDVSGTWAFEVQSPAGSGTPTMTFKQAGEKLTGTYTGQLGEAPLTGALTGTAISFKIDINVQGTALAVVYSGAVEGSSAMKGTVSFGDLGEGTFTAKKK